ncbi:hypothetical protein MPSEU_001031500 [Mayamaea pseudoterrestris]|nr:hypothetical protein MPSEU_001031500 [Mayamaea pseudoterrestris]
MKLSCFILSLCSVFALSVAQSAPTSNPTECLSSDYDPSIDYFPIKVQPSEATTFSIEYFNTYKIVKNLNSNNTYLLYQCGSQIPDDADISLFDTVLSIPIDQVGLSQTTQITYIEQLGLLNNIAFFLTDPEYNSSPCFADRIESGDVWLLQDGRPDTSGVVDTATDDALAPLNDLVAFTSPFDSYINTTATRIIVSEFAETTNQAIFEWLYFYSVFFNAEELATSVVAAADGEYDCIKTKTQSVSSDSSRPVALWAYYSDYCAGWSIGKCPSYYCEFARDSNVDLIEVADDFGEIVGQDACAGDNFLTIEQVVEVGQNASHWFFMAPYWNTTYETFKEQLDTMKSVQMQQVYDYQEAGENAWYQERLAEYYNVLHDFCATMKTCPAYVGPKWFRNVFTEEIGDEGDCSDRGNRFPFTFDVCDVSGDDASGAAGDDSSPNGSGSTSASSHLKMLVGFAMPAVATTLCLAFV